MNVLYFTFFENIIDDGIFESQVKELLFVLKKTYSQDLKLTLLTIQLLGTFKNARFDSHFTNQRSKISELKKEFNKNNVNLNIRYIPMIYRKGWGFYSSIPTLIINMLLACPIILFEIKRNNYQIIHCRSYLATLCALLIKPFDETIKIIFDVRGLIPEEGHVHNYWKENSFTYKAWKKIEYFLLRRADKIITLSDTFTKHLKKIEINANYSSIYVGINLEKFKLELPMRIKMREKLNIKNNTVFVFNGGLGSWHDPEALGKLFLSLKHELNSAKLLVLTNFNKYKLEEIFTKLGITRSDYIIIHCKPSDVTFYLQAGDYGIAPLMETIDNQSMGIIAETMVGLKVAEYLACGLPILSNEKIGGVRSLINNNMIGITFDYQNLDMDVRKIFNINKNYKSFQKQCRNFANGLFSQTLSCKTYYEIYRNLCN